MERRRVARRQRRIVSSRSPFAWVLRVGLGLLFVAASYYKLMSPGAFAHQIYNYKILPLRMINPIAITLPWLQLSCGLALIFNRGTRGASLLLVLMLFVFQVAVASALLRGLNISCGCFRAGGGAATWWSFARDFCLLILSLLQLRQSVKNAAY